MERELYDRWQQHDLRDLLRRAVGGRHVHKDEIDDLRVDGSTRRAVEQAIERVQKVDSHPKALKEADRLSAYLVESLGPNHETRSQYQARRASLGDPEAQAAVEAQRKAATALADEIWQERNPEA